MNKVQDRHGRVARLGKTATDVDITARRGRQTLTEQRDHSAEIMSAAHCGDVSSRAAEAAMAPGNRVVAVNGEAQRIGRARIVQDGHRDRATGKELPANLDGGKPEIGVPAST